MWAMGQAIIASNVRVPCRGDPASRARTRSGRRDGEEEAEWLDQVGCPGLVDEWGVTQRHMREDLAFEQLGPKGRHRGHFENLECHRFQSLVSRRQVPALSLATACR